MGVTVDKHRGNTIVEGVSVKSVTEGGSAALAKSHRGVGLKLGMYNVGDVVLTYSKSLLPTMQQKHTPQGWIIICVLLFRICLAVKLGLISVL